jgi:hypothetical protein
MVDHEEVSFVSDELAISFMGPHMNAT